MRLLSCIIILCNIFFLPNTSDDTSVLPDYWLKNIKNKTMHAIAVVESNDGKNVKHPVLANKSFAIGKYALMPITVRHVVKTQPVFKSYKFLLKYNNAQLAKFFNKNQPIYNNVAFVYYDMMIKELGTNEPAYVGYAWLNGPYKAKKKLNQNIQAHWHVKKIMLAYGI